MNGDDRSWTYPRTGQTACYDEAGDEIACPESGQDGEIRAGAPWPRPRFDTEDMVVRDRLSGLVWSRNANPADLPMFWREALDFVDGLNRECWLGFGDWRLPNRRELRSLTDQQARRPALPADHPFLNVVEAWYWSSTSAAIAPAYAWYVHMAGARTFYGRKDESCLVWPVRGTGNGLLPATGQTRCFDETGGENASGAGQDGHLRMGRAWPSPRFTVAETEIHDRLTGLTWMRRANATGMPVTWAEALAAVADLNRSAAPDRPWRLPNVGELETLVDCDSHSPALPRSHPFTDVQFGYWSSTTSLFEPAWAWALYLDKGAIGVGMKNGRHFHAWPVRGPSPTG